MRAEAEVDAPVGKPVRIAVLHRDRGRRVAGVEQGASDAIPSTNHTQAELPVNGHVAASFEPVVQLAVAGERLFVDVERSPRIGSGIVDVVDPEKIDVELAEFGQIVPHAGEGRCEPGVREWLVAVSVEGRMEQLIVQRNGAKRRQRMRAAAATSERVVPVSVAGSPFRIAIDVASAPLDISQKIESGLIFKVNATLPILTLRGEVVFEEPATVVDRRIGRIDAYDFQRRA